MSGRHHRPDLEEHNVGMTAARVTYDVEADAAYVYLVGEIQAGEVTRTVCVDPVEVGGMVNIDLDVDGKILGIEILDARSLLRPDVLPDP